MPWKIAAPALSLVVPLILRKRQTGSYDPPHIDPHVAVKGSPAHLVLAAIAVGSILVVMRYVLAPRIGRTELR